MKQLARFLVGLFMPVFLIFGGGVLLGIANVYDVSILDWIGLSMIGAGIVWGLFLFFWATEGPL